MERHDHWPRAITGGNEHVDQVIHAVHGHVDEIRGLRERRDVIARFARPHLSVCRENILVVEKLFGGGRWSGRADFRRRFCGRLRQRAGFGGRLDLAP